MEFPDNFADIIAKAVPSPKQMDDMIKHRRSNPSAKDKSLQNTTLLSAWLKRCANVEIPAIPAKFSQDVLVDEIFAALDGKPAPTVEAAAKWLKDNLTSHDMWRWEQCAPLEVKETMARGGLSYKLRECHDFCIDDPRLLDILTDCNVTTTRVAIRPVELLKEYGVHPVEFRCYVFSQDKVAISNYYPQRGLPDFYLKYAKQAGKLALKLWEQVGEPYTADFCLVEKFYTDEGHVEFLEGGPAWGLGAHPCCFNPSKVTPGRILLAPEAGAISS